MLLPPTHSNTRSPELYTHTEFPIYSFLNGSIKSVSNIDWRISATKYRKMNGNDMYIIMRKYV